MISKTQVYSLVLILSTFWGFQTFAADESKTKGNVAIFTRKDMPEYCTLPFVVPNNLTPKEYFLLAFDYADWKLPIHAFQCLGKLERTTLDKQMKLKIDRLLDTRLPKQKPSVEAVLLNLKANVLPPPTNNQMLGQQDKTRFDNVIKFSQECIRKYPNFEYGYLTLAKYQAFKDNHQASAETCGKVLQINPHNVEALIAQGDQYMALNKFAEAKPCFEFAFKYDPEDQMAKSRFESLSQLERNSNPFLRATNFISSVVGLFSLPAFLIARDSEALPTSGFINKSGKFLYNKINCTEGRGYCNGVLLDHDHYVDKRGLSISDKRYYPAEDFSEGFAAVCVNSQWGFLNTSGKFSVAPKYQDAKSFKEGLAPAKVNGQWGFIDAGGKWIIPPRFSDVLSFSDGLAAVVLNGKIGYVDHSGKLIIKPKYDVALSFSNGLAIVTIFETAIKRHHKICIDKSGKLIFDLTSVLQKLEGTKEFLSSGSVWDYGAADQLVAESQNKTRAQNSNTLAENSGRFSDGLLLVSSRNKYGYLNKLGQQVIPCKFESALPFKEGLAPVSLDPEGDWNARSRTKQSFGYIDKAGKFAIAPIFEYAAQFSEGLAAVKGKKGGGGFIDRTGRIVIPIPGGFADDFHDGAAAVGEHLEYP